jgi:hypothetical protein
MIRFAYNFTNTSNYQVGLWKHCSFCLEKSAGFVGVWFVWCAALCRCSKYRNVNFLLHLTLQKSYWGLNRDSWTLVSPLRPLSRLHKSIPNAQQNRSCLALVLDLGELPGAQPYNRKTKFRILHALLHSGSSTVGKRTFVGLTEVPGSPLLMASFWWTMGPPQVAGHHPTWRQSKVHAPSKVQAV